MAQTATKTHLRKPDFVRMAGVQKSENAENAVFTGFFRPDYYTNLCIKMLVLIDSCYSSGGVFVQNTECIKRHNKISNRLEFDTVKNSGRFRREYSLGLHGERNTVKNQNSRTTVWMTVEK